MFICRPFRYCFQATKLQDLNLPAHLTLIWPAVLLYSLDVLQFLMICAVELAAGVLGRYKVFHHGDDQPRTNTPKETPVISPKIPDRSRTTNGGSWLIIPGVEVASWARIRFLNRLSNVSRISSPTLR